MDLPTRPLSKSKYLSGVQCPKRLWWESHEPNAVESRPDLVTRHRFEQGSEVGIRARELYPGGILIDAVGTAARVAATRAVMKQGTAAIFEGTFEYDGVVVIADILERLRPEGWALIEVKSSTKVKPPHRPDVAVQLYVLRGAGVDVHRVELMHLSRECRCPDFSNLFESEDLTERSESALPEVAANVASFKAVCRGPLPETETGPHCSSPYDCPFIARCHEDPALVPSADLGEVTLRPGLAEALERFQPPLAFLDFETVNPAIPVWNGCRPYDHVPVQISVHRLDAEGTLTHQDWIAEGDADPREEAAGRILEFTKGANAIMVYFQAFEASRIRDLQGAVPALADGLEDVLDRLCDLHPVVRDHVRHPRLSEGFGLKNVLPVLVPELGYEDLEVADGATASVMLEQLLLRGGDFDGERSEARRALLEYCCLDTIAMVRLHQRLKELSQ